MNLGRLALAAVAATVVDAIYGFVADLGASNPSAETRLFEGVCV